MSEMSACAIARSFSEAIKSNSPTSIKWTVAANKVSVSSTDHVKSTGFKIKQRKFRLKVQNVFLSMRTGKNYSRWVTHLHTLKILKIYINQGFL